MVAFDAAVGASQDVFNNLLKQLYAALYKGGLLTQTISINQVNIVSAVVDILEPPVVDFKSPVPDHLLEHYQEAMDVHPGLSAMDPGTKKQLLEHVQAALTKIAFTIEVPKISFTLNYKQDSEKPEPPTKATAEETWTWMVAGFVERRTGDAALNDVLNEAVVPYVLDLLNKGLGAQNIPTLSFNSLTVAPPSVAIQNGCLVVYTALGNVAPDIPNPATWSTDGIFASIDADLVTAAGNVAIASRGQIGTSFDDGSFTGNVSVHIGPLSGVNVNSNGTLSATFGLGAGAGITWHTPKGLPNVTLSADGSGSIGATLGASVFGGSLVLTIQSLDKIDISNFDFEGIPFGGIPGLSDLRNWLINQTITPAITAALSGMSFKVYTISPMPITIGAVTIHIGLPTVATQEIGDAGKTLLVAHGLPVIT